MKRIVTTGLALLLQAGLAYAAVTFVVGPWSRGEPLPWQSPAGEGEQAAEDTKELGALFPLEEILVNVADTKGRRYLKTSMTLEIEGKGLEKIAPQRLPILRGRVIDILSSKRMEQLIQPGVRDTLRLELLQALNSEVSGGEFRDLFFTEFLVQ